MQDTKCLRESTKTCNSTREMTKKKERKKLLVEKEHSLLKETRSVSFEQFGLTFFLSALEQMETPTLSLKKKWFRLESLRGGYHIRMYMQKGFY